MIEQIRDYKIIKKIGEGGMGAVYLAEDSMLGRKVAIKVLNHSISQDVHIIQRFQQEAKLQALLVHPNIVTLHSFFKENTDYYIVMEFAEGETLKQRIKKLGSINEAGALKLILGVLDAVGYANSKGILHRDLKPSNIMVDDSNSVKIMDFGVAKILGDRGLTKTGTKMGTLYYMSPEQITADKQIDQRTDIYSLGITLYEMLTGSLPFSTSTDSDFKVMKEIVEIDLKDPRSINPNISTEAVELIKKMTNKKRELRFKTCYQCEEEVKKIISPLDEKKLAPGQNAKVTTEEFICSNCGQTVPNEADSCPYCGERFDDDESGTDPQPKNNVLVDTGNKKTTDAGEDSEANSKLKGVKGWLKLFALILTVFSPLLSIISIAWDIAIISQIIKRFTDYSYLMFLDIITIIVLTVLGVRAGYKLFTISTDAIINAKNYLKIKVIATVSISLILIALSTSLKGSGWPGTPKMFVDANSVLSIISIVNGLIYFAIWYNYLKKSKRVKATYPNQ